MSVTYIPLWRRFEQCCNVMCRDAYGSLMVLLSRFQIQSALKGWTTRSARTAHPAFRIPRQTVFNPAAFMMARFTAVRAICTL